MFRLMDKEVVPACVCGENHHDCVFNEFILVSFKKKKVCYMCMYNAAYLSLI